MINSELTWDREIVSPLSSASQSFTLAENGVLPNAPCSMDESSPDYARLVSEYLEQNTIRSILGTGIDGIVYSTSRAPAVKIHERQSTFAKELAAYQRLKDHDVKCVGDHAVPKLIGWDFGSKIIEMSIVEPPYTLDFANAALDTPPDFPPEAWDKWWEQRAEEFGDDWPAAAAIYDELRRRYGIYHLDLSPRNVAFARRAEPGECL